VLVLLMAKRCKSHFELLAASFFNTKVMKKDQIMVIITEKVLSFFPHFLDGRVYIPFNTLDGLRTWIS